MKYTTYFVACENASVSERSRLISVCTSNFAQSVKLANRFSLIIKQAKQTLVLLFVF